MKANACADMKGALHVQRAWKSFDTGNVPTAEADFGKAVESNPQSAFPHVQQGLFFLRLDRFEEAISSLHRAAENEPLNPAPLFFLNLAQEQAGQSESADATLEKLQQLSPRHQGLASLQLLRELRRGDPLPILTTFGFGLAPGQKSSKEGWRSLAAGLGVGDPSWLPPDLSSSRYLMGPILIEVEKRLLARELPQLERRAGSLLTETESAPSKKRKFSEEVRALRHFCQTSSKMRKGKKLLNQAFIADSSENPHGLAKRAIANLRIARRLDPFAFRADYHIGEAYLVLAKQRPGEPYQRFPLVQAEKAFLSSIQMDGSNPYVLFFLAFVSQALGRPLSAIEAYSKATERFTKLPEAHYGSGQCYLLLGDSTKARESMLTAVNSDLALGRERLNLFANLLREEGPAAYSSPFPEMPPEPAPPPPRENTEDEPPPSTLVMEQPATTAAPAESEPDPPS